MITITNTSFAAQSLAIWAYIRTQWLAANPNVAIRQENEIFAEPATALMDATNNAAAWVELKLYFVDSEFTCIGLPIGDRSIRHHGLLVAEFNTPIGEGAARSETLATSLCQIITSEHHSGITFELPVMLGGRVLDRRFYREVQCRFYTDAVE